MSVGGLFLLGVLAVGGPITDQVVVSGSVTVPRGHDVGEVVVLHGSATVAGVARGDVVVVDGPIQVTGQVSGSVIAAGGSVRLGPSAQVGEDVIASGRVSAAKGAKVSGTIRDHATFAWRGSVEALGRLASWAAVSFSTLLLGALLLLIVPRRVEAVAANLLGSPWRSLALGVGVAIGLPLLAVLAVVSLIALPLGLVLLLALAFLYWIGVALAEVALGRLLWRAPRSRWLALLIGWAIGAVVWLVPVLGGITWVVGAVLGLGAGGITLYRTRGVGGRHREGSASLTESGVGL